MLSCKLHKLYGEKNQLNLNAVLIVKDYSSGDYYIERSANQHIIENIIENPT